MMSAVVVSLALTLACSAVQVSAHAPLFMSMIWRMTKIDERPGIDGTSPMPLSPSS
jgi:hypothetical protein